MNTKYTHEITSVCPIALKDKANHLVACVGLSIADLNTFNDAGWEDSDGNLFCVAHSAITDSFIVGMAQPLVRPDFDFEDEINLDYANEVRNAMVPYSPTYDENEAVVPPVLYQDRLMIAVDQDAKSFLKNLGLTRVEVNDA